MYWPLAVPRIRAYLCRKAFKTGDVEHINARFCKHRHGYTASCMSTPEDTDYAYHDDPVQLGGSERDSVVRRGTLDPTRLNLEVGFIREPLLSKGAQDLGMLLAFWWSRRLTFVGGVCTGVHWG